MASYDDENYGSVSSSQDFEPPVHERSRNLVGNEFNRMDALKQELLDKCNLQPHLDGTLLHTGFG